MSKKKKQKKEKITYIDDGSSFTDMSSMYAPTPNINKTRSSSSSRFKDILTTYFDSVRMMFFPMLVTIGIISMAFLILWLLFGIK